MPKSPIVQKSSNDAFFTKDGVAASCVRLARPYLKHASLIVEPSAGGGSFIRALHGQNLECTAYDIKPAGPGVIKKSWFDVKNPPVRAAVVGNPPFGIRNALSTGFVKHALDMPNVETIAFILPRVWEKHTLQRVFPKNWKLVRSVRLPINSFTLEGEDYGIPCVFQLWMTLEGRNRRASSEVEPTDFQFGTVNDADFFVLGASPSTVIEVEDVGTTQRGYYIKGGAAIRKRFSATNWKRYGRSSVSGGVYWMTKPELSHAYNHYWSNKAKGEANG